MHTQTSGLTLTAEQPLNNIIRTTLQSLAAVLGGTNSLYTDSYDEALCLPSEEALRTALRVQQIIMEESGVGDTIDPLGGSYFLETLTDKMEEKAWELLRKIENMGGMIKAIESGWVQSETERTMASYMDSVAKGERVVVGYNKYQIDERPEYGIFTVDPRYEIKQKHRLKKLKAKRDPQEVEKALKNLGDAVSGAENIMRPCMQAARLRATFGEMTQAIYGKMQSYSSQFYNMKSKMFA